MSFAGYGVTLFNPVAVPIYMGEIPQMFTITYFGEQLKQQWPKSSVRNSSVAGSLVWTIPELDSGDDDTPFSGLINATDKGISFDLTPFDTIIAFLQWIRSIVPATEKVYFLKIASFDLIEITKATEANIVLEFLDS